MHVIFVVMFCAQLCATAVESSSGNWRPTTPRRRNLSAPPRLGNHAFGDSGTGLHPLPTLQMTSQRRRSAPPRLSGGTIPGSIGAAAYKGTAPSHPRTSTPIQCADSGFRRATTQRKSSLDARYYLPGRQYDTHENKWREWLGRGFESSGEESQSSPLRPARLRLGPVSSDDCGQEVSVDLGNRLPPPPRSCFYSRNLPQQSYPPRNIFRLDWDSSSHSEAMATKGGDSRTASQQSSQPRRYMFRLGPPSSGEEDCKSGSYYPEFENCFRPPGAEGADEADECLAHLAQGDEDADRARMLALASAMAANDRRPIPRHVDVPADVPDEDDVDECLARLAEGDSDADRARMLALASAMAANDRPPIPRHVDVPAPMAAEDYRTPFQPLDTHGNPRRRFRPPFNSRDPRHLERVAQNDQRHQEALAHGQHLSFSTEHEQSREHEEHDANVGENTPLLGEGGKKTPCCPCCNIL